MKQDKIHSIEIIKINGNLKCWICGKALRKRTRKYLFCNYHYRKFRDWLYSQKKKLDGDLS